MNIAVIVQARLRSSRLPGKTMLLLPTGRTVINEVLRRCCLIDDIDRVVAAIPHGSDCDLLANHVIDIETPRAVTIIRGSEDDVLSRYAKAAEAVNADIIMRITADCPLLNWEICGQILHKLINENLDYCSNCWPRTYADGLDCEVFTRKLLDQADAEAADPFQREHVTLG